MTEIFQILVAAGTVCVIAEIFVPGFVFLPIGLALILSAIPALWFNTWMVILPVLAAMEILVFFFFRTVLSRFHQKTNAYTNVEGMVGKECEVIENITPRAAGYVKLYGDHWKAVSDVALDVGSKVLISKVEGNKVWVEPISGKEEVWNQE